MWAGVVSIVEYTWMALAWKLPDLRKSYSILPGHFLATLIAASLSALFDITFAYYYFCFSSQCLIAFNLIGA